MAYIEVKHSY